MDANKNSDRRKASREDQRLHVRFWVEEQTRSFRGVLKNRSDAGAYIETDDTVPLLTNIRIEGPGFCYTGRVVRVFWVQPELRNRQSGGMAVRIVDSHRASRDEHDGDAVVLPFVRAVL